MELAGMQMASWVLPTHTWPSTASEPELGFSFTFEAIPQSINFHGV